jgi:hypothetical protein
MRKLTVADKLRLIAVAFWFTGGVIDFTHTYSPSAILSMASAILFASAILLE